MCIAINHINSYFDLQSNEVNSSYHMEKEGFMRAVDFIQQQDLEIGVLVTDRHRQIAKWVRENMPSTDHRYDIWHLAKGMIDYDQVLSQSYYISVPLLCINSFTTKTGRVGYGEGLSTYRGVDEKYS